MTTTSFVSSFSSEVAAGVASLDPPLIQQTKSEIRSLASEIAALAHKEIAPDDFFSGFLPRMVTAMGAEAAAVWQTSESLQRAGKIGPLPSGYHDGAQISVRLIAQHLLPPELLTQSDGTPVRRSPEQLIAPSEPHRRILQCVIDEGAPILVPPQSVSVETDRPTNPLPHSLIVVPVRVEAEIDYVLEVVQRASGGPAAQRGYLRFVAQMADLMADYLRRETLREHNQRASRLQSFEYWLTTVAKSREPSAQLRCVADGLAELLDCYQVLLLRSGRNPRVLAASGFEAVDPRSETVLAAQAVEHKVARSEDANKQVLDLHRPLENTDEQMSLVVKSLLDSLACDTVVRLRVDEDLNLVALLAYSTSSSVSGSASGSVSIVKPTQAEMQRVATALMGLVDAYAVEPKWVRTLWPFSVPTSRPASKLRRSAWQTWAMRVALVGLLTVIAFFPVPQQISATAVLSAKSKVQYFAPFDATVSEVNVEDDQWIKKVDVLLKLAAPTLEKELFALTSEEAVLEERIRGISNSIGSLSESEQSKALTAQLNELKVQLASNESQQKVLEEELSKREIAAKADGRITTWDVENRLMNLPVRSGQLLLSTIDPNGDWELQVSVPEHRVGLVSDALSETPGEGVPMHFTLASHPGILLHGRIAKLSDQAARNASGETVLIAQALIDGNELPLKKEGAIARVTIDCGRVPAIWLVVRDAYWACMSRLRMIW